jgi:hypothetical protein
LYENKLCCSQYLSNYFKSKKNEIIGGVELQQYFVGKGLREKGFGVSYVTRDYGQPDGENVDGLIILKTYEPTEG